ncbi:MAG: hypothetical protein ACTHM0_12490 [Sphingomonas sp.]
MKKYLIALAATTVFAAPALAVTPPNYQTATYGHDAVGLYAINANGQTFCRFGTLNHGQGNTNATVTTSGFGGANEGDGTFTMDIQNDNTDTVQYSSGQYNLDNVVCNTPFTVTVQSNNGGLKSAATTSDPAFAQLVPYTVNFAFDGLGGTNHAISTSAQTVISSNEARAGSAVLDIYTQASNMLVLQGGYNDTLTLSMTPTIS